MNLRKIEINGFKSFVNPVELDFSGGITAILGPNGCGKTNIVDAIRWVLGEQKTRMLRNTKMENVIFNGTKLRPPGGMAEVRMTLSNEDHSMAVDYGEVTFTRKLFRSGVSEYYLNGEHVRLKDIKGLLVDTGLGSHTYSIIEREMVDSVISEKEQDKRQLLEEAAGVMRYRLQREEALRKIKHTEGDLLRLGDILVELDKELRSLRYQMGKAKRYTGLKEKVDRMEAALVKRSLFEFLESKDKIENEKRHFQGITLVDDNEITLRDSQLEEGRVRGTELERRLQDLHENRYQLSQSLQQREEKIAIFNERIASAEQRIREDDEEMGRARLKIESIEKDLEAYTQTLESKEADFSERRSVLSQKEAALSTVAREFETLKNQLRDKKQLALDLVREAERERGMREHLEERLGELRIQHAAQEEKQEALVEQEVLLVERVASSTEQVEATRSEISRLQGTLEATSRESDEVIELIARCEDLLTKASIDQTRFKEKKDYLEKIRGEHGRDQAHRFASDERIRGILADHVHVERGYRRCFEACLSPVLPGLLAESRDEAFGCLQDIRRDGHGQLQVLYAGGRGNGDSRPVAPTGQGVVGLATDFVSGDEKVMAYLGAYLGDVVVVESLDSAIGLLERQPDMRVATIDGVFFDGAGRIQVAGSEDIAVTLLEAEEKIRELSAAIAESERCAREQEDGKQVLAARKAKLAEGAAQLRDELKAAETERDRILEDRRRHEIELAKAREQLSGVAAALQANSTQMTEIGCKLDIQPAAADEPVDVEMTDEELTRLEERAVQLEREKEALTEAAGAVRLEVATITGEIATAKEKRNNSEMIERELHELIVTRQEDAQRCRNEIETAGAEIEASRETIAGCHAEVDTIEKDIEEVKAGYEEIKEGNTTLERELKELTGRRDEKKENLQRCDLEIATLDTRIGGLIDKARENYDQDLSLYVNRREQFDPSEWEELDRADLAQIRSQLESFGPVNMLALEEFKERKERFDFLNAQKADLDEAKESLLLAIRRINMEARRRLSETFDQVRANFKATFQSLFDGGEADLFFVDSDDPLEANIKIVASPKGKRLHDISSLSGGERALVALSLLFAIYLVKPSPFCVFDEVDAPLDDANIGRFVRMLQSFTNRTQFIVITHNKKTMEAADHLYGVTMEEPGVSRMVSVHIGDVDRFQKRPTHPKPATTPEDVPVRA